MARFDFINSSSKAYEFIWLNRGYLARVAFPVFFIKLICILLVFVLKLQDQYLLQGLIYMPGFVLEAVFMIALIRYFLYKEPIFVWRKTVTPPNIESHIAKPYDGYLTKKQAIQSGIALYILFRTIEMAFLGTTMENLQSSSVSLDLHNGNSEENMNIHSSTINALAAFSFIIVFAWIFKFFWLFIPTTSGYSISYYIKKMTGLRGSFGMIATWALCSIPLMIISSSIIQSFSDGNMGQDSAVSMILVAILKIFFEITIISIQVIALTYGINKILSDEKN